MMPPSSPNAAATPPLQRSPLHALHAAAGARLVPFAGWQLPLQFQGLRAEHQAVREHAGLFDVSHMGRLRVQGTGATRLIDSFVTSAVVALSPGMARYTLACDAAGQLLDDLIVYRRGADHWLVICNGSRRSHVWTQLQALRQTLPARGATELHDDTLQTALIALQGPASRSILAACGVSDALTTCRRFHAAVGEVAGQTVFAARTGYTGEDGFELSLAAAEAPAVWQALVQAGAQPAGLGARDTLRLEAGLCLFGQDMDASVDPWQASLAHLVDLDKGPFCGSDALRARAKEPRPDCLAAFCMSGRAAGRHGHAVHAPDGRRIGTVTSGAPSPTLGRSIGLARIERTFTRVGTALSIAIRDRHCTAQIVARPFYRRTRPPLTKPAAPTLSAAPPPPAP